MICEDVDHISERWLSCEDIVLMSSQSAEMGSRASLDSLETISEDEIEECEIEPTHAQSTSAARPPLRRADTVAKGHWKNKKAVKECPGCGKSMSVLQSKHHCRSCGGVFCYYCTRHCRRLSTDRELDPAGKKYKVCKTCDKEFSRLSSEGQTRSWTDEFQSLSNAKHESDLPDSIPIPEDTIKRLSDDTDNRGLLRCTSVRQRLLDVYLDDVTKPTTDRLLEKSKKAARGNLFSLFKSSVKTEKSLDEPDICFDCKTNLNIEGIRKCCKVCNETFCIDCCDKDVVLTSRNSQRGDKEEPNIILGYKNSTQESEKLKKKERYRVCRFCKSQYLNENFLRDVSNIARQIMQLQKELIAEEEEDSKDLHILQMEYLQSYGDLCKVIPHSVTQRRLKQNVVNAAKDFYFERMRSDSRSKSQHSREIEKHDVVDKIEETTTDSKENGTLREGQTRESFFDMRKVFRKFSKPQEHASDYTQTNDTQANPEDKHITLSAFEQSNEWVNVTEEKTKEKTVGGDDH